jgi:hypothetical protein
VQTRTTAVAGPTASISPFHPVPLAAHPVPRRERSGPRPSDHEVDAARDQLSALLVDAATLEVTDGPSWDRLRADASARIDTLVAAGVLPGHLRVEHRAPATVVARTVATAWRWSQVA